MNTKCITQFFMFLFAVTLSVFYTKISLATQSIGMPTTNISPLTGNIPIELRISAAVSPDNALITNSVNLIQVNSSGVREPLSNLYDDGTHGDLTAADGIYTALITFNPTGSAKLNLMATAAYTGNQARIISPTLIIPINTDDDDIINMILPAINGYKINQSKIGMLIPGSSSASSPIPSYRYTLKQLAVATGQNTGGIDHIKFASYNDPFTLPKSKVEYGPCSLFKRLLCRN